ncbi:MAG: hypothetical protein IBX57_00905 [Gammaproteobacteria bacterium]|nr:hypothetical protein [Gammaproteobacteria bacterium]
MRIIQRTVYGSALQTAALLKIPHRIVENTTLNEKFSIEADLELTEDDFPGVNYYCIGNGGHRVVSGADGIPYTTPINHRATDAALFNHIPFVVRDLDDDLTIARREKYALRKIITVGDKNYIAYYLKRIDVSQVTTEMQHTKVIDGNQTTTAFVPSNDNLNPEPPALPNDGIITTDGNYVTSSAIVTIAFDEQDVEELMDVSRILYNDEDHAIISEVGLCSAVDRVVTTTGYVGTFNYREALGAQVVTHITGYYPVGYTNAGFELKIEAGATEPMVGEA